MRLPKRDIFATGLVATAGVLYLLWAVGSTMPALSGTRVTGLVILGLGFAASASAVVPNFEQLMHDHKAYMAVTSLIGVAALCAGVLMLVAAGDIWLGVMTATMGVLWLISTIHHVMLANSVGPSRTVTPRRPTRGHGALGVS